MQPTSAVTDSQAKVLRHCCSNVRLYLRKVRVSASVRLCWCFNTKAGLAPRPCAASQSSRCSLLTSVMYATAATGSWSSSGTWFTTASAHVCASLAGQRHQPTHWGSGGGHSATAPKQGGQRGWRKHTWRHADCSQEQRAQSHGDKAQASVSHSLKAYNS